MSIDYEAGIAIGFKVTNKEFKVAEEKFQSKNPDSAPLKEYLEDKNMLISLDGYSDTTDYILGYPVYSADSEGTCEYIGDIRGDFSKDTEINSIYTKYFYAAEWSLPRKIIYLKVY